MVYTGGWIVVLITTPSRDEAYKISRVLIEEKLAACINIVESVHSIFWWKGNIEESGEALMIVKTRIDKLNKLIETVKKHHSYTVPEIIALPIIAGNPDYLKWLDESITQ